MSAADLIVRATRIHTMTPDGGGATAIAITGDKIVAVGADSQMASYAGRRTRTLDLGAATVTPGLIDGHFHPVSGVGITAGIDLSGAGTLDEAVNLLRAGRSSEGEWVKGWGLDPNIFGTEPVSNRPLIEAFGPHVPAVVRLFDAHSSIASPAALASAGITGPREFAAGGGIVCDDSGRPNGQLREFEAIDLVDRVAPAESFESRCNKLGEVLRSMTAVGITGGNAMDFDDDAAALISALDGAGRLPIRIRFHPWVEPGRGAGDWQRVVDLQQRGGRRWKVDGAKFFLDGTVEGGTAWLTDPDQLGECHTPNWPDPAEYRAAVHFLADHGVPTATHAIGDAAVRWALETLSAAAPLESGARHRIEHIETVPDDLVPLFAQHHVVASMQPTHCSDFNRADQSDAWSQRLGPARAGQAFRMGDLRRSGAVVAIGSDWPVVHFDPRGILASAQLRRRAGHPELAPIQPSQALSARAALEGYTTQAAIAQGEAGIAGAITVGARASLTAFAVDPLTADPDELADAPITATVVDGEVVHVT